MDHPPLLLSYAGPQKATSRTKIAQAAAIGTLVSSGVMASIFLQLRLEVVRMTAMCSGSPCGTPIAAAEADLYDSFILLIIPAALWFTARRHKAHPRMTHTALVGAAATWLVCVASL